MKLDQLLLLDSEGWEKISDDDLKKFLEPFLKVTRPVKEIVPSKSKTAIKKSGGINTVLSSNQDMIKQLAGLLKQSEINLK